MPIHARWVAAATVLAAISACGGTGDAARPEDTTHRAGAPAIAGIELETLVGDCPVDSTARHADPLALAEEFARRSAEGALEQQTQARAWEVSALTCVERATTDHYEIIRSYGVIPGLRTGDSVRVLVERDRLFYLDRDDTGQIVGLEPAPGTWVDTMLVVRTTLGWRIHEVAGGAHRLPGVARSELRDLAPSYRRVLDSLASLPGV